MVERHALKLAKATVGLERFGKLDHTRHVVAAIGDFAASETAHKIRSEASSRERVTRVQEDSPYDQKRHGLLTLNEISHQGAHLLAYLNDVSVEFFTRA